MTEREREFVEIGKVAGELLARLVRAAESIAESLASLCARPVAPDGSQGTGSRETAAGDVLRESARPFVCFYCYKGEHQDCDTENGDIRCECEECNAPPVPVGHPYFTAVHSFEGMEDNHFCTRCGGGRLHAIHQG